MSNDIDLVSESNGQCYTSVRSLFIESLLRLQLPKQETSVLAGAQLQVSSLWPPKNSNTAMNFYFQSTHLEQRTLKLEFQVSFYCEYIHTALAGPAMLTFPSAPTGAPMSTLPKRLQFPSNLPLIEFFLLSSLTASSTSVEDF